MPSKRCSDEEYFNCCWPEHCRIDNQVRITMPSDRFKGGEKVMFKHANALGFVSTHVGTIMDKPVHTNPDRTRFWWITPAVFGFDMLIAEEDISDGS